MKVSLFFEMQIADPNPETEAQLFHDCVAQAELADSLGFHCVWAVEHHGLYEYSHSSAPEIFLSHVAARTERIRIGHGVTLLPHRYNHPIRIAERVATLDILSGGRVNWGTGKSSSTVEQGAFQVSTEELHDQWKEAVEIIPRMWSADLFEYKGRFFDIPPTRVIPKPVQRPHPPIFAACSKPESAVLVGRMGLGALNFALGSDDYLKQKVDDYRAAATAASVSGREKTNHFACVACSLVLDDDRKACEYGFRGARFFGEALAAYYFSGTRPTTKLPISRDFLGQDELEAAMQMRNTPGSEILVIGDPACARESLCRVRATGIDEIILIMQAGTVPHDLIMESLRTLGEQVLPHFA